MAMDKKKAIELVLEYEKKKGRNPEKQNKIKKGYNIKSGERLIDVKVDNKNKKGDLLVSFNAFKKLGTQISNYYIYIVSGNEEKPELRILEPDFILRNFNLLTLINIKSDTINKKIAKIDM